MSTPEGRIKEKIKRRLASAFGEQCWRFMPVQTGFGTPALDFILCFRGWFVTVETKTPTGRLTDLQKETRRLTLAAGGIVFCVYDDDTLNDFLMFIAQLEFIHGRYDEGAPIPLQAQDAGERKKHVRQLKQSEASNGAACGNNGASRKKPKRQPVTGPSSPHPAGATGVIDWPHVETDMEAWREWATGEDNGC